jgi:glycolate oxidase
MMISPTRAAQGVRPSKDKVDKAASVIAAKLGSERALRGEEVLRAYAKDESLLGEFLPDIVVRARTTEEISFVVETAAREGVPVVPRGGGTGRVGGALPTSGGIVLSLEEMTRILEIDKTNLLARVQPGVILESFQKAIASEGLFYPPDPSSLDRCTIGGTVACNAGGPRAFKYGCTGNFVLALEAVLPDGRIIRAGRDTIKGGLGYELHKLMVGSEGTLAVITEVTLRLLAKPKSASAALVIFQSHTQSMQAVSVILSSGLVPSCLEFMDKTASGMIATRVPKFMPSDAGASIIIEFDGDCDVLSELQRAADICRREGATKVIIASDERSRNELWAARRELSPALKASHPCKVSEDIVVPRSSLSKAIDYFEALAGCYGVTIAAFGHAGDGNIHVNVLFEESKREKAEQAWRHDRGRARHGDSEG